MLVVNHRETGVKKTAPVNAPKRRPGYRISLSMPVRIFGLDNAGVEFTEEARTILVSRNGVIVASKALLVPQQQVIVWCKPTGKQAPARVVGVTGGKSDGSTYALAMIDAGLNPWGVIFPPPSESEEADLRLSLQCVVCLGQEMAEMDELESDVFETSGEIVRHCRKCSAATSWKQASQEPNERRTAVSDGPLARSGNERKEVRAYMKLAACIRLTGFGEESVVTENISRQGVCFWSQQLYLLGSRIEVAVPYAPTGVNIFSLGRIVDVEKGRDGCPNRYRVNYIGRWS